MTRDDINPGEEQDDQGPAPRTEPLDHDERGGNAMNDDAFDRLRAADPAHDASEPVAGVLRAKVDALIGADAPAAARSGGGPSSAGAGADELAPRRSRRRQPWLVAAAVAGFVAVGGGGYAAGSNGLLATGGSGTEALDAASVPEAAPPITLDQGPDAAGEGLAEGSAGPGSTEEVAPDVQGEIGREPAVGTFLYPAPSHTVFHAGAGLSDDGGELAAYTLDARAAYTEETAERAARALGLRGDVRREGDAWVAGATDGSSASLRIAADGTTSLWFHDTWPDSWRCDVVPPTLPEDPTSDDGDATGQGTSGAAAPDGGIAPGDGVDGKDGLAPPCREDDAGAPSSGEAREQLRRVMEALDVDVEAFDLAVDARGMGTAVTAFHTIDGRRTGLQWSATVSGTGPDARIVSLNGFLAPVTELGTYPVVSEREAVERLGDTRFGASPGGVRTLDPAASQGAEGTAPDGAPAPLEPGAPIAWPVRDVTITNADLGVAQHVLTDGAVVLIPAYELTGAGGTWSVIAVVEDRLDFAGR
ncbi:hypothetical protein [Myceligenerans salitolerans]|uniref:Uncharacterized protein n=1 Tax=Myceligenerans salitolerans TaxID=1230528 RepID=A0ABS3IDA4_9MICO|nr:hypothetical protein [Myceligenerans salitolerans]MBO0611016.1 hypothetical protein [Myceligenerans salitolerans]